MKKNNGTKYNVLILKSAILVVLVVIAVLLGLLVQNKSAHKLPDTIPAAAKAIVAACAGQSWRPSCYDKVIPRYMDEYSLEDTLMITKSVQQLDPQYQYCHVLGHAISARETKKDPSKWKEVITRCPSGVCSNGCIHGAFQERFRTDVLTPTEIEKIKPDLMDVCQPRGTWKPTGMEQASCYHAVGHLLMYISNANATLASSLCQQVANQKPEGDFRQVCYDGVFMQMFQPLEPEDFALVKGKAPSSEAAHSAYCADYKDWQHASCWNEGWPLYRESLQQPEGLVKFCSNLSGVYQDRCYQALLYVLIVQFEFNFDTISKFCIGLPAGRAEMCYGQTASRLIETDWQNIDKAVGWCKRVEANDPKGACYGELAKQAGFTLKKGSAEAKHLCAALPKVWQEKCLAMIR